MIVIGQIREHYKDDKYPSIMTLIHKPINEKDKEIVLRYMKKCKIDAVSPASLRDLVNPELKIPELYFMIDGEFGWRSDVLYYFEKYDMELPDEFIQHVLSQVKMKKSNCRI